MIAKVVILGFFLFGEMIGFMDFIPFCRMSLSRLFVGGDISRELWDWNTCKALASSCLHQPTVLLGN